MNLLCNNNICWIILVALVVFWVLYKHHDDCDCKPNSGCGCGCR